MSDDERDEITRWAVLAGFGLLEVPEGYLPFDPEAQDPAEDVDDLDLLLAAIALPAGSLLADEDAS